MPGGPLEAATLAALFAVALVAGFVDSIAGGGGLLTVPALLTAGLPVPAALATNKLQASFGSFAASATFVGSGRVALRPLVPQIALTFLGAAAGAAVVLRVDPRFLGALVPPLLVAVALYTILSPRMGDAEAPPRVSPLAFAATVCPLLGFYDGFFGPGTGSFFAVAHVLLLGFPLGRATAHTKVLNFTSNIASLLYFLAAGQAVFQVGLVMGAGQLIGGRLGAGLVIARGARVVRPILAIVSIAVSLRLIFAR